MSELYYEKWSDGVGHWDKERWPNFNIQELAERMGTARWSEGRTAVLINESFMDKLQHLRRAYGKPVIITSGYRSPEYNDLISSTGRTGPHTTGRAVDIKVYGDNAFRILSLAKNCGFTGIGVNQTGDHTSRFIHLDDLEGVNRPWVWSY